VTASSRHELPRRPLEPEDVLRLEDDAVIVLDQRRLPDEVVDLRCGSAAEVAEAIRTLAVRGAPAIGVAAAYGMALAAARGDDLVAAEQALAAARPTAVNLAWALEQMRDEPTADRAREIHHDEVERCRRMASHAAGLLAPGSRVLTHCNTGALATGGYGSALGAIRAAVEQGVVEHVWVGETRPLLQGARLTAWEPFVVVAPGSTLDPATPDGDSIPIEERDPAEVSTRFPARNPAFDVTPAELISAIVTEAGVHRAPYAESLAGAAVA